MAGPERQCGLSRQGNSSRGGAPEICHERGRCAPFESRVAHYPPLRREMICSISELQANGLRVADEPWVDDYERLLGESKIVPASTEHGILGARITDVLSSGRALLISDRHALAYRHLELVRCGTPSVWSACRLSIDSPLQLFIVTLALRAAN